MSKKPAKAKMTPMEKELARVNYESMQRYQKMYMPMEAGFVRDVMNSERPSTQAASNEAAGSSQFAFERNQPAQEMSLATTGSEMGGGRSIFGRAGANEDLATSRAQNVTGARGAAKDAYYRNLGTLVAQGKGQEVEALQAGTQAAGLANKQAIIDAQASQGARMARNQLIGTAVGFGAGYGLQGGGAPSPTGVPTSYNPNTSGPYQPNTFGEQNYGLRPPGAL